MRYCNYRHKTPTLSRATACVVCIGIVLLCSRALMAADTVSAHEFSQLDEADQLSYLREMLLRFRRQTESISASAILRGENRAFDPDTRQMRDEVLLVTRQTDYDLRRIGDSYRVFSKSEPAVKKPGVSYPRSVETYDAESGEMRQLDRLPRANGNDAYFGTIMADRGRVAKQCFFYQYLGDRSAGSDDPYPSLTDVGTRFLEGYPDAQVTLVDTGRDQVEVTFPSTMPWGSRATCVETFDLTKDGLLTGMHLVEFDDSTTPPSEKYRYRVDALDPVQLDDAWIPTRILKTVWVAKRPNKVTHWEGTIRDIALNELSKEDLFVDFPAGAEVTNRITGERFRMGENGVRLPSTILDPVVDQPASEEGRANGNTAARWAFLALNVVVLGSIGFIALRRRGA